MAKGRIGLNYIVGIILVFTVFLIGYSIGHLQKAPTEPDETPIVVCKKKLTRNILDKSLELGTQFLLNNQKPEGNFNYEYDWVKKKMNEDDNQVRQAGALWGLALIYQNKPDDKLVPAIEKGLEFFEKNSKESDDGRKWIVYPNDRMGKTGTVALVALSIIDYLRSARHLSPERKAKLESDLDKYLKFLVSVRERRGLLHQSYTFEEGRGMGGSSPYFDGESLLALVKAAKYLGKTEYKAAIFKLADAAHRFNVKEALRKNRDSATTKGFYQWGSMSYFEMATSGWGNVEKYGDIVIELADWMIDVHKTLKRGRNTAYAYEGIVSAYEMARLKKDKRREEKYACVIDQGLLKLTSWQVGGPVQNDFLRARPTDDKLAVGGIMNARKSPPLRIDVTQHQMHAVILARRYAYK
ncbi:MAG: hypothetical protein Kow0090_14080 [Myxococcota bacterium]